MGAERTARWSLYVEAIRKSIHTASGVAAFGAQFLVPYWAIGAVSAATAPLMWEINRRKALGEVQTLRQSYGEVYYAAGVALTAFLFPSFVPFSFALLVLVLGDSAASLVGKHFGRRIITGKKTVAGAIAFFAVTLFSGIGLLVYASSADPWQIGGIATTSALLLTAIETLSTRGMDNLWLPLAAAAMVSGL